PVSDLWSSQGTFTGISLKSLDFWSMKLLTECDEKEFVLALKFSLLFLDMNIKRFDDFLKNILALEALSLIADHQNEQNYHREIKVILSSILSLMSKTELMPILKRSTFDQLSLGSKQRQEHFFRSLAQKNLIKILDRS